MKIVFLVSSLGAGGAERVATTLCNAWAQRGDEVTLVPTFSGGGTPFYRLDPQVDLIYLSSLVGHATNNGKSHLRRLNALRRLIRQRNPDSLVSFLPNVNVAALLATAFTDIPCIVCERTDPSVAPLGPVWSFACRALYPYADIVTVQTESVAARIGRSYRGLRRVAVTPNPLPQEIFHLRPQVEGQRQRRTLLSLGRLTEGKGVGQIIEVFSTVVHEYPQWDLHIYGDGPQREALQTRIEQGGLQGRVVLCGRTTDPWRVMAGADAFVMNSRYEGFPNALLEAMGLGLPCISSDCPSGPQEISAEGRDALLFEPGDLQGLRSGLVRLMSDSAFRMTLGERARQGVMARYSLDAVLRTWDELFTAVKEART